MSKKTKSEEVEGPGTALVPTGPGLSGPQEAALELLLAGESPRTVAAELGLSPDLVQEWRRYDPAFVAAANRRRQDDWEAQTQRLSSLTGKAVDTLSALLESPEEGLRLKAAALVLKAVPVSPKAPRGPTTAAEVTEQWEAAEAERQRDQEFSRTMNFR